LRIDTLPARRELYVLVPEWHSVTDDWRTRTTGIVVAGGRSTRFGDEEKALADLDGQPMLAHVVSTLGELVDTVVVNCRPDQQTAFADAVEELAVDVQWALDDRPDEGPLSGLATALAAVDTELAVVLGCDMPLADPGSLSELPARLGEGDAAVPRTDGGVEPLHAVYRVDPTRAAARAALDGGERSLRTLLDRLAVIEVDADGTVPTRSLTSVDTQELLREIEEDAGD